VRNMSLSPSDGFALSKNRVGVYAIHCRLRNYQEG
jgi:hypothetical protein